MTNEKPRLYSLLIILGLILILSFLVLRPFLFSLVLASAFAIVFRPLYQQLLKRVREQAWLASLLTILILILFILVPLALLALQIFQEAESLYVSLYDNFSDQSLSTLWPDLSQRLNKISPIFETFSPDLDQYLKNGLSFLVQNLGTVFSNLAKVFVNLFVFLVALFFLLKDGDLFKKKLIALSPLTKDDDELIARKITQATNSVLKGSLLVATLQGISSGIGLTIFGVPNPVIWGTVAALGALVPGIGTTIVLIPAITYLYFTGQVISALGLLAWGALAVGLIDNFLGPHFVGKGAGLHPLLILLSVLGGLSLFGPIGFILGPLTISLLLTLLDIYASIVK